MKQNHSDILEQSKSRSPVSHVSVLMKKDALLSVGNYLDFPLYEDYYLWIRLLKETIYFITYRKYLFMLEQIEIDIEEKEIKHI